MSSETELAVAALRSDRFRLEREADWERLEVIVSRMERGRRRGLSDDDVLALPTLYRTLLSSLATARETSLDAGLIAYLEGLTLRAYFLVYGTRTSFGRWIGQFLGGNWGRAVRAVGVDVLIALAAMVAGVFVGYLLVAQDPEWFYALVPAQFADVRVPGASVEALRGTLFDQTDQEGLSVFAAYLFSNNAQVSILAFALGFAFGVPTILLLIHNMALLGAMLWVFAQRGLAVDFLGWLSVHGTTEIFGILLAGAAGIHIGRAVGFPGHVSHLQAMSAAGRRASLVMVGVVIMMIVAGLLEAFPRQLVNDTGARFAIAFAMLGVWLALFYLPAIRAPVWQRERD